MTTANNPVVTAEQLEAARKTCADRRIFCGDDHLEAIYLAMTQASPREPTATEREALHMAHRASAEVVEYLAPPDGLEDILFDALYDSMGMMGVATRKGAKACVAAIQSIGPLTGWQPIETAPKDGTRILAIIAGVHPDSGDPFTPEVVHWQGEWWNESWSYDNGGDYLPTHWMPLPNPPALKRIEGQG